MRHYHHLDRATSARLFAEAPVEVDRHADNASVSEALGATLYLPGTRPHLVEDLARQGAEGLLSAVVCLEDAVSDGEVEGALRHTVGQLDLGIRSGLVDPRTFPLVFVRVRTPEQILQVARGLGPARSLLAGFVLPKFGPDSGPAFLEALHQVREETGLPVRCMPVIETAEAIALESRAAYLLGVRELLERHREQVLAVRLGATDLSAIYALRRDRELTIYDLQPVASLIGDVVNVFGRADGTGFTISGPVWEYFSGRDRLFKPQLRSTPFEAQAAEHVRRELLTRDLDGLLRETSLDLANGLRGKTVIHPSHVAPVHALCVVSAEEHADATDILRASSLHAVQASSYANKMNETKPHRAWAERILRRARAFGVAAEGVTVVDFLTAAVVRGSRLAASGTDR